MDSIGPLEIGLIAVAIVLVFGVGKLGEVGGALGKSIHEFRKERDRKEIFRMQPHWSPKPKGRCPTRGRSREAKVLLQLRQQGMGQHQVLHGVWN